MEVAIILLSFKTQTLFLHNLATIVRIMTMSSDLESSHYALSISTIINMKYRSFVSVLNKIDP